MRIVYILTALAFIINIITCLVLWFYATPTSQQVALHYNVVVGFDELGTGYKLYQLPALAFLIGIVNLFLVRMFKDRQVYIAAAAGTVALVAAIVLLFAAVLLRFEVAS